MNRTCTIFCVLLPDYFQHIMNLYHLGLHFSHSVVRQMLFRWSSEA